MKGVCKIRSGRYNVRISLFGKVITLGTFDTEKEAGEIYDAYDKKYRNMRSEFFCRDQQVKAVKHNHLFGYFGVEFVPKTNRYSARIRRNQERLNLGVYETPIEAAIAINRYLDSVNDTGPRNDFVVNDIIELEKRRKEKEKQQKRNQRNFEMKVPKLKTKHGPEYKIQQDVIRYLQDRGWYVRVFTAGLYNFGFTDIWAAHPKYGQKWIEIKRPIKNVQFTPAQIIEFPKFISHGVPIYILTGANEENYKRLFGPSNLWLYLTKVHTEALK